MESVPDPKIHPKGKINHWYRYYRYFNAQVYVRSALILRY